MKKIRELHRSAMDIAEQATQARRREELSLATELFAKAFELEKKAADALRSVNEMEPDRSILFRSAAALALEANLCDEAEKLAAAGLAGNAPSAIAEELRHVLEQAQFSRHLATKGIELGPSEFQLSISGRGVGFGFAPVQMVWGRIESLSKMLQRTAERRVGANYREKGRPSEKIRILAEPYLSTPRPASFALTIRVGSTQLNLSDEFGPTISSSDIVEDVLTGLACYEREDAVALQDLIPEDAYYRNFLNLARSIAPDGDLVTQVGFTAGVGEKERKIALRRPRGSTSKMISHATSLEDVADEIVEIEGLLQYADSTRTEDKIKVLADDGKTITVTVLEGMMADIVRPLWDRRVRVRGKPYRKGILLDEIYPIDE
ncbi:MAG: hypothetical protein KDH09_15000 [Chrysiogenetes bacterium]|nr:hypothetical protein [Chrysiogenetes bacterium]